ncbi:unnamed protein product [Cuscuta campestris]|uniref:Retrotransposon gag domain-containing protein n=1 Tax=Cuscuta campestris TaxID=132261 RepID=A0A484LSU6_9ASTE|nr:unnamed protein product [Cuscuta campestris]
MNLIVNYDNDHHSEDGSMQQNDHQNMNMNQNVPHQEAPNGGPVGVPQIDHAMMMQLLQQVLIMNQNALAHVRLPEPRITLEKLKKNGAEEFLGENITDPLIAFRWIERIQRVFENLKVPASEWADFAVMLLQSNAYEWWKRTTRNANHPAQVTWAYFDQVFREEYIPESFVEEKREEFLQLEMGTMSLPEYRQMFDHLAEIGQDLVNTTKCRCDRFVKGMRPKLQKHMSTASRQDFGVMYEQAKEVVQTKEGVRLNFKGKRMRGIVEIRTGGCSLVGLAVGVGGETSLKSKTRSTVSNHSRNSSGSFFPSKVGMSTLKSEPSLALGFMVPLELTSSSRSLPCSSLSFIFVSLATSLAKYSTWAFKAALEAMSSSWDKLWDSFDMSERTPAASQRPQRPRQPAAQQQARAPARTYAMQGRIDPNQDVDYGVSPELSPEFCKDWPEFNLSIEVGIKDLMRSSLEDSEA